MKKNIFIITALFVSCLNVQGQTATVTTGRIDSLKDSWGEYFYYTGDIKNKLPNGLGVAHYYGNYVLWYGGYFINGKYEGKGALMFGDGFFLSGNWKNGKLNGAGSHLNKEKDFYVGTYKDGMKNGAGTYIFKDNSILTGNFKNDKYDGRCIYINTPGDIISDNIYTADKKNGPGYQYELSSKTLYKGNWKDGVWEQATDGSYQSFLLQGNFLGEQTNKHILIGSVDKTNDNLLYDTSFYYDLESRKKHFGLFRSGFLQNGITLNEDSTIFIGALTPKGATGFCHFYKVGKYYDEGNYVNDFLTGPDCLSIDIEKKTLYYGNMTSEGVFSGKAWFVSKSGNLYNGTYERGSFTGYGSKITIGGMCIKGNWNKGNITSLESITDGKGQKLNLKPATMTDAISLMSRLNESDMDALLGDDELDWVNDKAYAVYKSYFKLPGASVTYIVEDDDYYLSAYSIMLTTDNYAKAAELYKSICAQVGSAKPVIEAGSASVTMVGETVNPKIEDAETISLYRPAKKTNHNKDFSVAVRLTKNTEEDYEVSIVFGTDVNAFSY